MSSKSHSHTPVRADVNTQVCIRILRLWSSALIHPVKQLSKRYSNVNKPHTYFGIKTYTCVCKNSAVQFDVVSSQSTAQRLLGISDTNLITIKAVDKAAAPLWARKVNGATNIITSAIFLSPGGSTIVEKTEFGLVLNG